MTPLTYRLRRARIRLGDATADLRDATRARTRPLAYATRRHLRRVNPTLLATLLGAAASFGLCFVVVADAMRSSEPTRPVEQARSDGARVKVALGAAPALKVDAAVLTPVRPVRRAAASRVAPAEQQSTLDTQTQTQTQNDQQQPTQTQPQTTTQATKPKPKATPKPTPKGPDFDDAGPSGPSSGSG